MDVLVWEQVDEELHQARSTVSVVYLILNFGDIAAAAVENKRGLIKLLGEAPLDQAKALCQKHYELLQGGASNAHRFSH